MNKSIKVLSVNVSDTSGGAARAAYRIHNAVRQQGISSQMFVKHKGSEDENVLQLSDFDKPTKLKTAWRFLIHKIKNKLQQKRWRKYPDKEDVFMSDLRSTPIHGALQKIDFDVLHLHWINLRFLDLNVLKKINKPIIWTLHDCWAFTGICHYFYECERYKNSCGTCPFLHSQDDKDLSNKVWKKKKEIYSSLNLHIVTPSNWMAEAARESSLLKHFPVTVIPNVIDTNLFSPANKVDACGVLELDSNKKYILYGAMNAINDKNKGFAKLLEAVSFLEHQIDITEVELVVIGDDKPLADLQTAIPVHYLGLIKSDITMVAAYRVADLMVVPSLSENLSNAIMESLSCGTPVVAFDIGGNSDMIEHKRNGYLARKNDSKDLADGIVWCLTQNENGNLSTSARLKIIKNFEIKIVSEMYYKLYLNLM